MDKGYYPYKNSEKAKWFTQFKTGIAAQGSVLGMTALEIATAQATAQSVIDAVMDIEAKKNAWRSAVANLKTVEKNKVAVLRKEIIHLKTVPTFDQAIGEQLGVVSQGPKVDKEAYQCKFNVQPMGMGLQLKFFKKGVHGINIYRRKAGDPNWVFLARASKSPYHIPAESVPATSPQHWEFLVYGVMDDQQIGQPSDIIECLSAT